MSPPAAPDPATVTSNLGAGGLLVLVFFLATMTAFLLAGLFHARHERRRWREEMRAAAAPSDAGERTPE
ncbi:hypothetical protein LAZ40_06740 [Cereibacter sphaeroides]|uniref:hypothetical protein n=1 Tax=Cereibacter sphaeroides TaxID=1063 RepID=UPI001F23B71B|nr:hypothetical protein [Cereibacter sphaeroides]MCE6958743.1 hypothetical protein [Cereibacter sphaeroides]MCE6973383.1 hypothetical protein [Cereibacter sphaeroides]